MLRDKLEPRYVLHASQAYLLFYMGRHVTLRWAIVWKLIDVLPCCRPSPYVVSNNLGGGFGEWIVLTAGGHP